jgi:hypothetical protein
MDAIEKMIEERIERMRLDEIEQELRNEEEKEKEIQRGLELEKWLDQLLGEAWLELKNYYATEREWSGYRMTYKIDATRIRLVPFSLSIHDKIYAVINGLYPDELLIKTPENLAGALYAARQQFPAWQIAPDELSNELMREDEPQ